MSMRALMIGPDEKAALASLRQRAAEAPVRIEGLVERMKDPDVEGAYRVQMDRQSIVIPIEYVVTYSVEDHPPPHGLCRHVSVSIPGNTMTPTPASMAMIASELGFVGVPITGNPRVFGEALAANRIQLYLEPRSDGGKAVNLIQQVALAAPISRNVQ